jgi:hypothetical protein
VTAFADLDGAIAALRQGATDYILKPLDADSLRARLARIAETRRVKEALRHSEAALEAVLEAAPCMIVILNFQGNIRYVSPSAQRLCGYRPADVTERRFTDVFFSDDPARQTVEREMGRLLKGASTAGFETSMRCRDGSLRWMVWNAQRLEDYRSEPAVLTVGQDITELTHARQQALQSERLAAIGEMITGLAHESRNALQRSQACLEMLSLEVRGQPAALDLVARIQASQDHLHQLYEEVRDYAAPVRLKARVCSLTKILSDTWEHLARERSGRQAELHIDTDACNCECTADPLLVEQVFRNVLENSLAACADPVEIKAQIRNAWPGGNSALAVSLRDNGAGLSAEAMRRIFEPFFTTKTKGTGLGMAIAKRLVEAHGGQITVGRTQCPGAEIVITLPRQCEGSQPA